MQLQQNHQDQGYFRPSYIFTPSPSAVKNQKDKRLSLSKGKIKPQDKIFSPYNQYKNRIMFTLELLLIRKEEQRIKIGRLTTQQTRIENQISALKKYKKHEELSEKIRKGNRTLEMVILRHRRNNLSDFAQQSIQSKQHACRRVRRWETQVAENKLLASRDISQGKQESISQKRLLLQSDVIVEPSVIKINRIRLCQGQKLPGISNNQKPKKIFQHLKLRYDKSPKYFRKQQKSLKKRIFNRDQDQVCGWQKSEDRPEMELCQ